MSLVWERAPYTAGSLLVLLALADWSNDEGVSWPSIPRIASKTRLERRSIQYIIRSLKKDGILEIEEGRGRGHQHRYSINAQKLRLLPNLVKGEIDDIEKVQFDAEKAQSTAQKVQPISPNTSEEPSVKPLDDPSVGEPPFSSESFLSSLRDYEQHRREIRKPLTPMARKKLYRQLEGMGEKRSIAALEHSMAHSWVGVYEEKNNGAGPGRQTASQRNVSNIAESLRYLEGNDKKLLSR